MDINTLRNSTATTQCVHEHCNLDEEQWISPATARRLSCDASLTTVLEDENGKVLNIGRRSRTVPSRIRKALALRDTTCRFPGCTHHRHVDAHHIKHWADGGETKLDNLVTLCRYHHRLLHQGEFEIRRDEKGLRFFTETGRQIENVVSPQFSIAAIAPATQELDEISTQVDERTCVSQWNGIQPDYNMIIDGLMRRDEPRFRGNAPNVVA